MNKPIAHLFLLLTLPFLALAGLITLQVTAQASDDTPAIMAPAANLEGSTLPAASPLTNTVMYTVTDLGDWRAYGLNEAGQVVGISFSSRAILWLPEPTYGLPAGMNDLGTLGGSASGAASINEAGQIAGWSSTTSDQHAFLWLPEPSYDLPAGMNDLGHLGGGTSRAYDVNDAGQVVGISQFSGESRAFLWEQGVMTNLGTLGGTFSLAYGVNGSGQVVGESRIENDDDYHPFLWENGAMIGLETLGGGPDSAARDINDAGDIVGESEKPPTRPILWLHSGMNELDTLADSAGRVRAINNVGQMIGASADSDNQLQPVIWDNDAITDLNELIDPDSGWVLQSAEDINDAGQIVGYGTLDGEQRAFLLTPEEKAWTVMFYLAGDNDLSATYPPIFNQLEGAANDPDVNVVVLWDGPEVGDSATYHVQYDTNYRELADYVEGETMWSQGEVDMGFPTTLSDFAIWAMNEFPARHYALILDDHGSGLGGGLADETSGGWMNLPEMQLALATIHEQTEEKIDVLYMAMCLMGMIEDAYQFRNYVDYYVANEHIQWAYVAPYYPYVAGISGQSSPAEVAQNFAAAYADEMTLQNKDHTISVVDIAQLDPLVMATQQLGEELDWHMEEISATLTAVLTDVQRFDNKPPQGTIDLADTYIDLYHFADLVSLNLLDYGDIVIAATAVMSAVDNAVIYERHGSSNSVNLDNSHGISIFFPSTSSSFYHPDNYDFAVGAHWDDLNTLVAAEEGGWGAMLVNYVRQVNPDGPDDSEPPAPVAKLLPESSLFLPIVTR